jgi:hypothetical protein
MVFDTHFDKKQCYFLFLNHHLAIWIRTRKTAALYWGGGFLKNNRAYAAAPVAGLGLAVPVAVLEEDAAA